jgi:uncharacterized protein YaaN involved in tellurite resistance
MKLKQLNIGERIAIRAELDDEERYKALSKWTGLLDDLWSDIHQTHRFTKGFGDIQDTIEAYLKELKGLKHAKELGIEKRISEYENALEKLNDTLETLTHTFIKAQDVKKDIDLYYKEYEALQKKLDY